MEHWISTDIRNLVHFLTIDRIRSSHWTLSLTSSASTTWTAYLLEELRRAVRSSKKTSIFCVSVTVRDRNGLELYWRTTVWYFGISMAHPTDKKCSRLLSTAQIFNPTYGFSMGIICGLQEIDLVTCLPGTSKKKSHCSKYRWSLRRESPTFVNFPAWTSSLFPNSTACKKSSRGIASTLTNKCQKEMSTGSSTKCSSTIFGRAVASARYAWATVASILFTSQPHTKFCSPVATKPKSMSWKSIHNFSISVSRARWLAMKAWYRHLLQLREHPWLPVLTTKAK